MDALGAVLNVVPVADDVLVKLNGAGAVTFVCYNASGDSFVLREGNGATTRTLATITRYSTGDGVGGAWAEQTQAASATVTISGASGFDACVFTVAAKEISDGYDRVKVASTGSGTVVAITHDLTVARRPSNYSALVG